MPQTRQRFYRHRGLRVAQQGIPFGKNMVPKSGQDLASQEFDRSPNGQHHPFELRLGVHGETRAEVAARRQGQINPGRSLASTGEQNFLGGRQRRRICGGRCFTSVELSWTSGATPGGIWYGAGKRGSEVR